MIPTAHITWDHEDNPEGHVPQSHFILLHSTPTHGPHLVRHTVCHQIRIHSMDFSTNCLIPITDAELMDGYIFKREGYDPQHLRALPNITLILKNYILSVWWLHLLAGLGHHVIPPGAIENVLVMANNLVRFVYTYDTCRPKIPLYIVFCTDTPFMSSPTDFLKASLGYGPPRERPAPT